MWRDLSGALAVKNGLRSRGIMLDTTLLVVGYTLKLSVMSSSFCLCNKHFEFGIGTNKNSCNEASSDIKQIIGPNSCVYIQELI